MTRYAYTDENYQYRESETKPPIRKCDFCTGNEPVYYVYATENHPLPDPAGMALLPKMVSTDGWAACKTCTTLIDNRRWARLLDRAVDTYVHFHPEAASVKPQLRKYIAQIQDSFRNATHRRAS